MIEESKIMEILTDWNFWGSLKEDLVERPAYLDRVKELFGEGAATCLFGVRRSGKSSLAYLFLQGLIRKGMDARNSLIVNFDDPRFPPALKAEDLMRIYETYLKKVEPSRHVVLLDEVQNIAGWEKFVRYLIESKKAKVAVTGSSSKLMGREISTALTGRHLDMEVFPLGFSEFLRFRGLRLKGDIDVMKERLRIMKELEEYMKWGGFPKVALTEGNTKKRELLAGYFEDILTKDVVRRFGVREIEKLESLATVYLSNISTLQSFNRLKAVLGLSLDTIERFSRYMEIARLFFSTRKFEFSVTKQLRSVKKTYTIDPGFFYVKGFRVTENYGKVFENVVGLELLRRAAFARQPFELYYWRDYRGREVDFVLVKRGKVKQLVQASYQVEDPDVKRRELAAFLKAARELRCRDLLLVTWDYESEERHEGRKVRFVPLWKWLLGVGS